MNNIPKEEFQKYAMVVPCHNEGIRLPYHHFLMFAKLNPEVLICFVNDASTDETPKTLRQMQLQSPENISILTLGKAAGRSAAIRHGILHIYKNHPVKHFGVMDASFEVSAEDWLEVAVFQEHHSESELVLGKDKHLTFNTTRINFQKGTYCSLVKGVLGWLFNANYHDAECDVKIFHRNLIPHLFNKPFHASWLFDVEIFLRLLQRFGRLSPSKKINEYRLGNSLPNCPREVKLIDKILSPIHLAQLYYTYKLVPQVATWNQTKPAY
ncbi:glycosyltransferase [Echinicola pacifica]|nr:glycosyltransferase [Echinicola pacifica]